jgi:hypothetical protein
MAQNEAVTYKEYMIYPLALYLPPQGKWAAMTLITRDMQDQNLTLPRSQSFPQLPGLFDDASASKYALDYGRMLVDRKHSGLTI